MQWTFHKMFDQFSDPNLPLHRGLWGPKESQFDRKSWFFVNVALSLVSNLQVNTKTDLSAWWNEHSVRCLTSYQSGVMSSGGVWGQEEAQVDWKSGFSHNVTFGINLIQQ